MAFEAYMTINADSQGDLSSGALGSDSVSNEARGAHEDEILVTSLNCSGAVPLNPNSGKPTSQARHNPVIFTTPWGKPSPMLTQALNDSEPMDIEIKMYRTATAGNPEHYYTIKWTGAVLVEGSALLPTSDSQDTTQNPYERYGFTFSTCERTHEIAGTSASFDWDENT